MTHFARFSILTALTLSFFATASHAATCTVVSVRGQTTSFVKPAAGDEIQLDLDHLERLGSTLRFRIPAPVHPFVEPFVELAPGVFQRDRRPMYATARWFTTNPENPRSPWWNEFVEYGNSGGSIRSVLAVKKTEADGRTSTVYQMILDCR